MAGPDRDFAQAVQLLQAGRLAEARRQVETILATRPDHFEAQHLGAIIAFQSGDRPGAIAMLKKALELKPDHVQALSDIGMMCHAIGDFVAAEPYLARALELQPKMAAAHLNMGNVLMDSGRQQRAERHYREALRLQPNLGAALNNLSRLLLSAGRASEAAELARKLIALAPNSPLGHSRLGAALDRLGQLDEAIAAHRKAIALNPSDNSARLAYASSLAGYGKMDDAIASCRQAIDQNPRDALAYAQLTALIRLGDEPELEVQMSLLFESKDLAPSARGTIGFALGRAAEQRKDYAGAFGLFEQANTLFAQNIRYDPQTSRSVADDTISAFPAEIFERFKGAGHADPTPIFIVGMPRSGTTLTEQILCAHPGVFGAGEPAILRSLADRLSIDKGVSSLAGLMQRIEPADLEKFGADYVGLLRQYSSDATRIIDKVPGNFIFVGLIRLCLPNAKIIHCRRHPADTCLSIYKNRFATGSQLFAYDLDNLAAYCASYQRVMAHWDEVLPGEVHTVTYEQMVADQLAESQRLYAHCGLDWTDDALEFFKTSRPVHTASIAQVRRPIYGGSSGIASHYGEAARPLFEALERAGVTI